MRIGITCTTIEHAITQEKIDGIGTYTKNLYETLLKKEQNMIPFSFPNTNKKISSIFQNGQFFRYSYSASTISSLLSLSIHKNLHQYIDILHVTDHMLPKIKNIPMVATICDAIMFHPYNWHWDTIRLSNIKKWARKKTIHWADHFITISQTMVKELVEYIGIQPEKISVVYLGIDNQWFEKISEKYRQEVLKKFNLPNQFLLFAGTLQHKKNLPRIVEAYLQLPIDIQEAYPLVIVGRLGWGTEESLAAIQKLQMEQKGVWLNYVSLDELRVLFQSASLYLHPSLHEGFGLTLLEAFASNTPTLTSHAAALPEIAQDAAFLVDPCSISEIKHGIQQILTTPSLQQSLIQKGNIRAREFSWEKCAEETLKVYQQLLG